jgi:hypothetical protein
MKTHTRRTSNRGSGPQSYLERDRGERIHLKKKIENGSLRLSQSLFHQSLSLSLRLSLSKKKGSEYHSKKVLYHITVHDHVRVLNSNVGPQQ